MHFYMFCNISLRSRPLFRWVLGLHRVLWYSSLFLHGIIIHLCIIHFLRKGSDQQCRMECRKYRRRCKTTTRTNFQACAKECEDAQDSRCEESCTLSLEKCLEQCDIRQSACELGCSTVDRLCPVTCQRQSETCAGSCDITFHSCTDV